MKRREFITLLGGAAVTWPLAARAQQPKTPTIGFLGANSASAQTQWTAAFVQRLRELGWIEGRTVSIEYRWAEGRRDRYTEITAEFVETQGRCHRRGGKRSSHRGQAGDIGHPNCLRGSGGPGWHRPRRKSGTTR